MCVLFYIPQHEGELAFSFLRVAGRFDAVYSIVEVRRECEVGLSPSLFVKVGVVPCEDVRVDTADEGFRLAGTLREARVGRNDEAMFDVRGAARRPQFENLFL